MKASKIITSYDLSSQSVKLSCRCLGHVPHAYQLALAKRMHQEHAMSLSKRYAKKQAKARQRRHLQAHARLERDRRQAQRAIEALEQALHDLGLRENLVEIKGRLRSQH
jgi:hypothetical protein